MRPTTITCLIMLVCAPLGGDVPPQVPANSATAYRQLIAAYRGRDREVPHRAARLSPDDLKGFPYEFALNEWPAPDLLAAAMMHLEACVELLQGGHPGDAYAHANVGGRFLDAATIRGPEVDGFARRWYAALIVIADASEAHTWREEVRKRAAARFPPTPARRALADALKLELRGVMEAPGSRSDPRWLTPRDQKAVQFFRAAAEEFAKAESMDPTLLEAPLHQGRSWLLAGESARAIAPLERAARSADLPVRYLSVMLLGAIDEGADRFEIAESRYRAAIAIAPFAQSAPLALAQLMTRQGRGTEARAVVAAHFQRTDWQVAEPLWNYLAAPSGHLTEALQNLRAEVWR